MDPRHLQKQQPRASAYDWRGHLKPWALALTEELARLWLPPEPQPPSIDDLLASIWRVRR